MNPFVYHEIGKFEYIAYQQNKGEYCQGGGQRGEQLF